MSTLTRATLLARKPDLELRLDARNQVAVMVGGEAVPCGPYGLAVLEAFSRPATLDEALRRVQARGAQDWMDLTSVVVRLYEAGVLLDGERGKPAPERRSGFASWSVHVKMLNDRVRTASYLRAIAETVRPGDVVVDIGTGTGVLAVAAARAGARQVFAVEASGIATVAREVFARSGVGDRITLVESWSTQAELPEPADVIVSEIIGNDPFGERVLEVLADARRRLARPGARSVPRRLRVYVLPVTVPEEELVRRMGSEATLARWRSWYDLDLSPLALLAEQSEEPLFFIRPQKASLWPALAEPALVANVDLEAEPPGVLDTTAEVTVTAPGLLSGLLMYFELDLSPTVTFSTHPARVEEAGCWRSPVWVPARRRRYEPGERLSLRFEYGHASRWTRLTLLPA